MIGTKDDALKDRARCIAAYMPYSRLPRNPASDQRQAESWNRVSFREDFLGTISAPWISTDLAIERAVYRSVFRRGPRPLCFFNRAATIAVDRGRGTILHRKILPKKPERGALLSALHEQLARWVGQWRADGYLCDDYPAISEILEWSHDPESGILRYLRRPQVRALETYWHLRLILQTPHIYDLYKRFYPQSSELREALGLTQDAIRNYVEDHGIDALCERVKCDDDFVRDLSRIQWAPR